MWGCWHNSEMPGLHHMGAGQGAACISWLNETQDPASLEAIKQGALHNHLRRRLSMPRITPCAACQVHVWTCSPSNIKAPPRSTVSNNSSDLRDVQEPCWPADACHSYVCWPGFDEQGCRAGEVLFGTDSHTCNAGAFGQFASGIGNTDAGFILGTGKLLIKVHPPRLPFHA